MVNCQISKVCLNVLILLAHLLMSLPDSAQSSPKLCLLDDVIVVLNSHWSWLSSHNPKNAYLINHGVAFKKFEV